MPAITAPAMMNRFFELLLGLVAGPRLRAMVF
jgi:hypothetical protein